MKKGIKLLMLLLASALLMASCSTMSASDSYVSSEEVSAKTSEQPLGIMSAMDVELAFLLDQATIERVVSIGGNDFNVGTLEGQPVVIVKAGVGKSLSAACTAILIDEFDVSGIVFTGIAGGVAPEVEITDVVISTHVMFHDYGYFGNDGKVTIGSDFVSKVDVESDPVMEKEAYEAAVEVLGEDKVYEGLIATGDQFMANAEYVDYLYKTFDVYAVEMEGASVGYVASQYDVPFVVIRSMSDKADGLAHEAYNNWYSEVSDNSGKIVMQFMKNRAAE
ncbi:MAG: 5'-methylthioadenosine/adenosylhomocysteine nucleosidase [Sphaerochaeta sp.]